MAYSKVWDGLEARKKFPNAWATDLSWAVCADPLYWCFSSCCCGCAAYQQRKRVLLNDWNRYVCCGGMTPCSGNCCERRAPQLCLCLEVFLCFNMAVTTTRFMIQDALQVHNTPCDNCIIGTMFFAQYLACVCNLLACMTDMPVFEEATFITDRIADVLFWCVCSCMQTQQHVELNKRDKALVIGTRAPGTQTMTRN